MLCTDVAQIESTPQVRGTALQVWSLLIKSARVGAQAGGSEGEGGQGGGGDSTPGVFFF